MTAPPLVDTHCHLTLLEQRGILDAALAGARAAGVLDVVTIGVNLKDSKRSRALAEAHEGVWFTVGWDPQQPAPPDREELRALDELLRHPRAVGVGEIGLDLCFRPGYHETPLDVQRESLRTMLHLALEHGKPVVVHDRDAHHEVLDELDRVPEALGVMHCFTGDAAHAARCLERGFVLSFSGIVTFAGAATIQQAAREVPPDAYVVETDAPFLAPVPHRGTVNLPERVAVTASALAAMRNEPVHDVRAGTSRTARRLFGLPEAR